LGARLALIAALLHFLELEPELDLLGSGHSADLREIQLDTLWAWTRRASKTLSWSVLPSDACNSPDDASEESLSLFFLLFPCTLQNSNEWVCTMCRDDPITLLLLFCS
jgi:hypothetical protein